eukprot:984440-Lingulodinium_polyedra.AAC.1
MPVAGGATLWYERQTDRIRGSYRLGSRKVTFSTSVAAGGLDAALRETIRMAWHHHCEATNE